MGAVVIGLGTVVGWLVATAREFDELKGTLRGTMPDQTITPTAGGRIESGHHLGGDAGFGGGGGDGGGGGGAG